jgi:hypothetical protein
MPAAVPPPQTLKQAKRAYQKSNKGFTFTPSQERAAARRNAKDESARKLREKEDRAKNNKRKRDEKEEKERQAKKLLVEKGQLSADALLPKVRSSQPRLSAFLQHPTKPVSEPLPALSRREEDDETVKAGPEDENTVVDDNRPPVPSPPKMDEEELDNVFSTAPAGEEKIAVKEKTSEADVVAQPAHLNYPQHSPRPNPEMSKDELEAQLGCRLSQAMLDFDICEDPLSDSEQPSIAIPSPRKRKRGEDVFATPTKSARSALSEMSPGRVLLRSQEKPDMTSAPSLAARLMSPRHDGPSSSQLAQDTLAMISTQDFADDSDFSDAKENTDPVRDMSPRRQPLGYPQGKSAGDAVVGGNKSASKLQQMVNYDFDDSAFDEAMDEEEGEDYDDGDVTDAVWVGLSSQPPKNTAVSSLGSPKKAKATNLQTPSKVMAPPPRPSPLANLITKLKAATPKKPLQALTCIDQVSPSASRSLDFDDGISDADLAEFDMQMAKTIEASGKSTADISALDQAKASNSTASTRGPSSLSKAMYEHTAVTPEKARASPALIQHELPPASQSFGLDDGMDEDLLALVDETDFAGSSATKRAKKGRTLPWENRTTNWNAMMAENEQSELLDGISRRDA